jgi:hypothetical protein
VAADLIFFFFAAFYFIFIFFYQSAMTTIHNTNESHKTTIKINVATNLRGVSQLIKFWVYFVKVISSSPANLRAIGDLHGR